MKIHRSQLPADIAAALAPRTFAQERPEDDQAIEVKNMHDEWVRGTFHSLMCSLIETSGQSHFLEGDNVWREALEIEDDAPEPEKKLPEPGHYFIANSGVAYRNHKQEWRNISDAKGYEMGRSDNTPLSELPADWQPLSQVIEQAARAEGLEARVKELEADVITQAEMTIDLGAELEPKIHELEAKLKQQDEILDSIDMNKFRVNLLGVSVDSAMAFDLHTKLAARRKAQEAQ